MDKATAALVFKAVYEQGRDEFNAAYATRMLTLAGLVLVVYDHVLTFKREYRYIWHSPRSLGKYAFLLNRYIVPACMVVGYFEMSGFIGYHLSDKGCAQLLSVIVVLGVISLAMSDVLVLMRVLALWEGRQRATWLICVTYFLSTASMLSFFIRAFIIIVPGFSWDPFVNMCIVSKTTPLLIAVWGSALAFEVIMLTATCWNAIDRPRSAQQPLLRTLRNDGMVYFGVITFARLLSMALAATNEPDYAFICLFFTWGLVTIFLNRLIINLYSHAAALAPDARAAAVPLALPSISRAEPVPAIRTAALHSRPSWNDVRDGPRATRSRGSAKDALVGTLADAEDGDKAWEMGSYGGSGVEVGKIEWVVEER